MMGMTLPSWMTTLESRMDSDSIGALLAQPNRFNIVEPVVRRRFGAESYVARQLQGPIV